MGRRNTGAVTINQCVQIPIKSFVDYIKKGKDAFNGTITWNTGANINISLSKVKGCYMAGLNYTITDNNGTKHKIDYKVTLVKVPSNLGTGVIYYFRCPSTGNRCKTLYLAYNSKYFVSRGAYTGDLYYASQLSSKLSRNNDTYWRLTRKLEQLEIEHPKKHYKGSETKAQKRINHLTDKQEYHDLMRWYVLPVQISKAIGFRR